MGKYLDYQLDEGVDGQLKFQITYQSPKVNDFMKFMNRLGVKSYLTKTGYKVAISDFPEFKISENTIFLRGKLKSQDNKVDVTRFASNSPYRKGAKKLFNAAMTEFISEVEKADNAGMLDNYDVYYTFGSPSVKRSNPLAGLNKVGRYSDDNILGDIISALCGASRAPKRNVTYISL